MSTRAKGLAMNQCEKMLDRGQKKKRVKNRTRQTFQSKYERYPKSRFPCITVYDNSCPGSVREGRREGNLLSSWLTYKQHGMFSCKLQAFVPVQFAVFLKERIVIFYEVCPAYLSAMGNMTGLGIQET